MPKVRKKQGSRHGPAFVLLFLSRGPNYGAAILTAMQEKLPYFLGDSAMVYRTLQDLENEGAVTVEWQLPKSGSPLKYYYLTDKGWQKLLEFEDDIRQRLDNFKYFLEVLKVEKERRSNS